MEGLFAPPGDNAERELVAQNFTLLLGHELPSPRVHDDDSIPRAEERLYPNKRRLSNYGLRFERLLWRRREPPTCGGFMELAGLEPATSWVRSRRSCSYGVRTY